MSTREPRIRVLTVARHMVGGIRTYLRYAYKGLDPERHQFTIVAPPSDEAPFSPADLPGFEVESIVTAGRRVDLDLVRVIARLLWTRRFDLVHSQGFTAGFLAAVANLAVRTPHIITPHEILLPDQFPATGSRLKKRAFAMALGTVDCIQFVGEDARRNFVDVMGSTFAKPQKLAVIRHGIDLASFPPPPLAPGRLGRELGLPADRRLLAFLGRFMPAKGFDVIIKAVRELAASAPPREPFLIVAMNDGAYIREYRAEIGALGLADWFIFPGFHADVPALMADFDAVLAPSRWETAGLVAMEAMVSGVPVIASDCIGLREYLAGSPAIVTRAGDQTSLAEGMRRYLEAPEIHRRSALDFAPAARAAFDVRRTSAELAALFTATLKARGRPVPA
jgi:glycosyltransferase involved in cell wall biosynthesis